MPKTQRFWSNFTNFIKIKEKLRLQHPTCQTSRRPNHPWQTNINPKLYLKIDQTHKFCTNTKPVKAQKRLIRLNSPFLFSLLKAKFT